MTSKFHLPTSLSISNTAKRGLRNRTLRCNDASQSKRKGLGAQNPDIVISTSLLLQYLCSKRDRGKKIQLFVTEQSFAKIVKRS